MVACFKRPKESYFNECFSRDLNLKHTEEDFEDTLMCLLCVLYFKSCTNQ